MLAQVAPGTWTLTTAPNSSYTSIAGSENGSTLIAGSQSVYISTNGGASWNTAPGLPGGYFTKVAISADGSHLAAMNYWNWIYVSKDHGASWTQVAGESNFWQSIAFSGDGSHFVAASAWDSTNQNPGHVYTSPDAGTNWNQSDATGYWTSVASSADGFKLSAVASGGMIFLSTNAGVAWFPIRIPTENWCGVASSADGLKLAAVASVGPIYRTADGGRSWIAATNAPITNWATISSSSDGALLVAAQSSGQVYISDDAGATWATGGVPDAAQGYGWVASSSPDGKRVTAAGIGPHSGLIYVLQGIPSLEIVRQKPNLVVSWPAAALGFNLEQASDLVNGTWTNVPIISLNESGQNQATFESTERNQFFRLRFPTGALPLWGLPPPILPPPPDSSTFNP